MYGSGHPGAENAGSREGKPNMDPIDFSDFYTPLPFRVPLRNSSGKMGPYLDSAEHIWSGFNKGYNAAEAGEKVLNSYTKQRKYFTVTDYIWTSSGKAAHTIIGKKATYGVNIYMTK